MDQSDNIIWDQVSSVPDCGLLKEDVGTEYPDAAFGDFWDPAWESTAGETAWEAILDQFDI